MSWPGELSCFNLKLSGDTSVVHRCPCVTSTKPAGARVARGRRRIACTDHGIRSASRFFTPDAWDSEHETRGCRPSRYCRGHVEPGARRAPAGSARCSAIAAALPAEPRSRLPLQPISEYLPGHAVDHLQCGRRQRRHQERPTSRLVRRGLAAERRRQRNGLGVELVSGGVAGSGDSAPHTRPRPCRPRALMGSPRSPPRGALVGAPMTSRTDPRTPPSSHAAVKQDGTKTAAAPSASTPALGAGVHRGDDALSVHSG